MNTNKGKSLTKTQKWVLYGLFTAIIVLMTFTPLGYFKTAGVEITFMMIPVAVGAMIIGPGAGAFLGGVFGITSFIQAVSGMSAFGAALWAINPLYTFIICIPARILAGWIAGLVFKAIYPMKRGKNISFAAGALSASVLNTVFFVGFLIILFGRTDYIQSIGTTVPALIAAIVGLNGVIEACVGFVVGTGIAKAVHKAIIKE